MAKYNRDFLVPYLSNICALHLKQAALKDRRWELKDQKSDYNLNNNILELSRQYKERPAPVEPKRPWKPDKGCVQRELGIDIWKTWQTVLLSIGLFFLILTVWYSSDSLAVIQSGDIVYLLVLVIGTIAFLIPASIFLLIPIVKAIKNKKRIMNAWDESMEQYEDKMRRYEDEMRRYVNEVQKYNDIKRERARIIDNARKEIDGKIQKVDNECREIEVLINRMYQTNIIPMRYRDFYAAIYLYDWFAFGSSDDMDMALNTYVLENIKDKLDIVIRNQSQSIINQQQIIANQYRSMEQQRAYQNAMRVKMDQLQLTQEEELKYTKMIESNTAAMAYFSKQSHEEFMKIKEAPLV